MRKVKFRKSVERDASQLLELFQAVAQNSRGIARNPSEISADYIEHVISSNCDKGLSIVALYDGQLIGSIHATSKGIKIFDHVLSSLTIGVHPMFQGKGLGRQLFEFFLSSVESERRDIYRVELESRAANDMAIDLYGKLGFTEEGRMKNQTRNLDGTHEDGIMMVWYNPSYDSLPIRTTSL